MTEDFENWVDSLRDVVVVKKIEQVMTWMEQSEFGDHKPLAGCPGVFERRLDKGPGYRIYYCFDGHVCVLLLYGGTKRTQKRDIKKAMKIKESLKI